MRRWNASGIPKPVSLSAPGHHVLRMSWGGAYAVRIRPFVSKNSQRVSIVERRNGGKAAFRLMLTALLVVAGGAGLAQAVTEKARTDGATVRAGSMRLQTAAVRRVETARERLFEGVIEADKQSTVSAQTSGRIIAIHFDVNDRVEQGALLVEIDDTQQKAALEQARAGLKAAQAKLIAAQEAFNRISQLFRRGTAPKAQFDQVKAEYEAAQAGVKQAEAALKQAEEQLSYTKVRAPYAGIVTARHAEVGELAAPGKPLMSGYSEEEMRAHIALPQRYVPVIRKNRKASVVLDLAGRVRREVNRMVIFPYSDPKTNTVTVRLYMADRGKGLFPGMLVKGAFMVERARALAVPERAVARRGELAGVYRLQDGHIQFIQVRTGRPLGDGLVEVLAGLEEGDVVALDPLRAAIALKEQHAKAAAAAREAHE